MPLPAEQLDAYLRSIHRALLLVRTAAGNGDAKKAYAIADSFEELPEMIRRGDFRSLAGFRKTYFEPLLKEYPELPEAYFALPQP